MQKNSGTRRPKPKGETSLDVHSLNAQLKYCIVQSFEGYSLTSTNQSLELSRCNHYSLPQKFNLNLVDSLANSYLASCTTPTAWAHDDHV